MTTAHQLFEVFSSESVASGVAHKNKALKKPLLTR
jgi:hypothetical protein